MSAPTAALGAQPTPSKEITALDLHMMPYADLIALYHDLDAPPFEEMYGEFAARLLDQGTARAYLLSAFAVNVKGRWLCKAFEPSCTRSR